MEFERVGRYLNDKMCLLLQTPSNLENDFQRHFSRSVTKEHSAACWPGRGSESSKASRLGGGIPLERGLLLPEAASSQVT